MTKVVESGDPVDGKSLGEPEGEARGIPGDGPVRKPTKEVERPVNM